MTSRFPFPAHRHPGKRKRETSLLTTLPPKVQGTHLLQRRIGQRWEATRAPTGALRTAGRAVLHTKAARLANCRGREKAINPSVFAPPPDGTHNWHLTATTKISPEPEI